VPNPKLLFYAQLSGAVGNGGSVLYQIVEIFSERDGRADPAALSQVLTVNGKSG